MEDSLEVRQSADGSIPVARGAEMNSAHPWHTMPVREHGFAVEWKATFHFLEARLNEAASRQTLSRA